MPHIFGRFILKLYICTRLSEYREHGQPRQAATPWGSRHIERRLLTQCSGQLEISQISLNPWTKPRVDARLMWTHRGCCVMAQSPCTYQCGFYACSFWFSGHARASSCGTGKSSSSHIFFYAVTKHTSFIYIYITPNPGTIGNRNFAYLLTNFL